MKKIFHFLLAIMMCGFMTAPLSAQTTGCDSANMCTYTFILYGEWDDSWVGSSFSILQNDSTVANVTLAEGLYTDVVTLMLCNNVSTSLVWNSGGGYDYECSFVMLDHEGDTIYATSGTPSGTLTTFVTNCMSPCPRPTDITVTNISTNSAEVGWTVAGTETSWNLEYKVSTDATWTVIPVTTNPYTLTNLTNLTNYNVRVQANCGGSEVSEYRESSFATAGCDTADQCTFTFTLSDSYNDGWGGGYLSVLQNDVVVATLELTDGGSATETVQLCSNYSTSILWTAGEYANEAGFSVVGPNISFSHNGMNTYTTYTFTCNCIIDPTVATEPASNIEQTTATLNGTITNPDNVTITAKGFEWKATAGGTYAPVTVTGNNLTYNLTGLTANTGYTYKAFITFNGTTVYGDETTFTTLPEPCAAPTDLQQQIALKDEGGIYVCWTDNANVSQWNLQYRLQNSGEWTTIVVTGSPCYSINGLINNENYEVRVQAVCAGNNLSEWSEIFIATATNSGIDNHLLNSITLYPNPANDVVNVQCTVNNVQLEGIEVIDVYGKVVRVVETLRATSLPTRINVSGLAAGMYFVRVTTDEGIVTKQFVKR